MGGTISLTLVTGYHLRVDLSFFGLT